MQDRQIAVEVVLVGMAGLAETVLDFVPGTGAVVQLGTEIGILLGTVVDLVGTVVELRLEIRVEIVEGIHPVAHRRSD